jgi:Na+/H+-dicarboxylate symporter
MIESLVPENVVKAAADGDILPLIVASLLFGAALSMAGERGRPLSEAIAGLNEAVMRLVHWVVALAPLTLLTSLEASLYSMLRLSDDIGTMSNRILEMADKILVMADNIGLMADRILATQLIQNSNIELVVAATMQTQQNTLTLFSMFL